MSFSLPPRGVEVVLLALVLVAAVYDIRFRRIPNWLTVGGVLTGLGLNTFLGLPGWGGVLFSLKGLALGFGVYFALYAIRAMGAGDVKLMAAVGSLVGYADWFGVFIATAIIGGILSVIVAVAKGRLKKTFWNLGFILGEMKRGRPAYIEREELDVKNPKSVGLPHGAVIGAGTVIFLALATYYVG